VRVLHTETATEVEEGTEPSVAPAQATTKS
jgi:hypothetical protein